MVTHMISGPLFPASPPTKEILDHRARQLLETMSRLEPQQCSDAIVAALREGYQQNAGEPITWIVSQAHPLVSGMKIVRMFIGEGGVEVYSHDGKIGMRNLVPMISVRLTQEAMPLDIFEEELIAAESDEDDDDDPDEPEFEPEQPPSPSAPSAIS